MSIFMEIPVFVGGTPGKNCGGFCDFCYFKTADYQKLEANPINLDIAHLTRMDVNIARKL